MRDYLTMRRPELDHILGTMLDSQPEVSDLLFTVDKPLQVESFGELKPVAFDPPIEKLTPFQTEMVALNLIGDNQWHIEDLLRRGSCDAAYTLTDKARFRINIFSQRGNYSIVCRKLNTEIPTLEGLNFPEIISMIPHEKTGLVLVTGATGSGKSTTLAAILNDINHTKAGPRHHARRPGGVRPSPSHGDLQPARAGHGLRQLLQRPACGPAPGAESDFGG